MKRQKRSSQSEHHLRRVEQAAIRRRILIIAMGGECEWCSSEVDLEFHHTEPREWTAMKASRWQRQAKYEKEFIEGKLQLLCSSCNKKAGVPQAETEEQF